MSDVKSSHSFLNQDDRLIQVLDTVNPGEDSYLIRIRDAERQGPIDLDVTSAELLVNVLKIQIDIMKSKLYVRSE